MSKANGAIEKKDTYLQHVSLKNYKSIKDVEIDFKPGLNIIIGKNGSGKTNFINALNAILNFKYNDLLDTEYDIKASFKKGEIDFHAFVKYFMPNDLLEFDGHIGRSFNNENRLKINGEGVEIPENLNERDFLRDQDYYFLDILIKHGTYYREDAQFINLPLSFVLVNNGKVTNQLMSVISDDNRSMFIEVYFYRLNILLVQLYSTYSAIDAAEFANQVSLEELKIEILSFSDRCLRKINNLISDFSPIKGLRLNPNFIVIKDDIERKLIIANFYLEFLVDENWLTFRLLSDGTKRLFYIISEILSRDSLSYAGDDDLFIALLEEPELGIHPHQLHKLMQFIKEQSREKQIIITTHSPQVLDALGPDELDRIIICHSDPKNGTQLSHLSEKEIVKAKKYMKEEAFLSDYWRFSDLEPA